VRIATCHPVGEPKRGSARVSRGGTATAGRARAVRRHAIRART